MEGNALVNVTLRFMPGLDIPDKTFVGVDYANLDERVGVPVFLIHYQKINCTVMYKLSDIFEIVVEEVS